jgi:hypothetical protein
VIAAIETRYAGCRFRSRLEARWAVFFSHLGMAWEYEPEGFKLSMGHYLPDFRVWNSGQVGVGTPQWVEVKGVHPTRHEIDLIEELFWVTRTGAAIVYGDIECRQVDHADTGQYRPDDPWGVPACVAHYGRTPTGWGMTRPWNAHGHYEKLSASHDPALDPPGPKPAGLDLACRLVITPHWQPGLPHINLDVPGAVRAARSARFEHGESGA